MLLDLHNKTVLSLFPVFQLFPRKHEDFGLKMTLFLIATNGVRESR